MKRNVFLVVGLLLLGLVPILSVAVSAPAKGGQPLDILAPSE